MLFEIYLVLLFICFITGLISVYKARSVPRYLKIFPWFIFITLVIEIIQKFFFHKYVQAFYNLYSVLEFICLGYLLYQIIESESIKRFILLAEFIYLPASLIDIFFIRGINHFHTITYLPGAILLVFLSACFLYELFFKKPDIDPIKESPFWITCGMLLFHSCSASIILVTDFLSKFSHEETRLLNKLMLAINLLYYSLFTIGFLCILGFRNPQSV
jgi:hypothetical protein